MSSWQCGWVSRAGFFHMLSYWSTRCFAARILELNKYPYQQKILYTVEIKYKRTQVKEIRYEQLPASTLFHSFRVWVSSPPPTLFTMGPEMRNLLLRYFDFNTISMKWIGSSLSRVISALHLAQEYFLGYYIFCAQKFSFFQGPSSISCFKSCCDCCRTRDVIFRCFFCKNAKMCW